MTDSRLFSKQLNITVKLTSLIKITLLLLLQTRVELLAYARQWAFFLSYAQYFEIFAYKNLFHSSTIIKFPNCNQFCNCAYVLFLSNCSIETVNKLLSVELSLFVTVLVSHLSNRLLWFAGFHNCIQMGKLLARGKRISPLVCLHLIALSCW